MVQNMTWGASGGLLGERTHGQGTSDLSRILALLDDSGCHFGPYWILKGVPKVECFCKELT